MDEVISISGQVPSQSSISSVPEIPVAVDDGLNDESLRRVQACLIACEGITTDDLEAGIIQEMRQTLKDVVPLLQNLRRNCA